MTHDRNGYVPLSARIRPDQQVWLADEAGRRVVGRSLLVRAALDLLREAVEQAPDLVDLPPRPRGEHPQPTT